LSWKRAQAVSKAFWLPSYEVKSAETLWICCWWLMQQVWESRSGNEGWNAMGTDFDLFDRAVQSALRPRDDRDVGASARQETRQCQAETLRAARQIDVLQLA
jgi:hypothetical protein